MIDFEKIFGSRNINKTERSVRKCAIIDVVIEMTNMPLVECGDLGRIARDHKLNFLLKMYSAISNLSVSDD